jgi:hypothetical protein
MENVDLKQLVYRMGGAVATIDNVERLVSVGGVALPTYSKFAPGSDPKYWGNRQSHFSIFTPIAWTNGADSGLGGIWDSAFGGDDVGGVAVGLCGYNNGGGTASPVVGQGTGYIGDQSFAVDSDADGTDEIYVFGGYPQWGGDMARYDPDTNSWSAQEIGDSDGLYMDGGGLIGTHWYKVHKEGFLMHYDATPGTDAWAADIACNDAATGLIPVPDPKFGAGSGVINGKLYIVDTYDAAGAVYEIDPGAGTWTQKASTPLPRGQAGTVVYDGKLYLIGGRSGGANTTAKRTIQIYNPANDTWYMSPCTIPGDPIADKGRSGMLTEIVGGQLYVGNGLNALDVDIAVIDDLWRTPIADITIPEPSTMMLLGSGLIGLLALLRKKK